MTGIIPYGHQDISDDDISAVINVLRGEYLTQGPAIDLFESELGSFLSAKHTVAVSNGTAGLHIAYLAAGIGPGDAVIVPGITFAATSNAVLYCGAVPIFADIDPKTACISPESIQRCIDLGKKAGFNVKAIAPVHYAGLPCDMASLVSIAQKHSLFIIEDACHALGAEYRLSINENFQRVGSADFTSMAVFSFHPVKHITTGEGGAVTTNNPDFAKRLRLLRSHGITKDTSDYQNRQRASTDGKQNPWYHEMQSLGLNYRMCDIQAALGQSQAQRAKSILALRRNIAKQYDEAFTNRPGLKPAPADNVNAKHGYHLYPIRVDFQKFGHSRTSFMTALRELGVGSQVHYIPVPWHPYYENHKNLWLSDTLRESEKFYGSELSIPMFSKMNVIEVQRVIDAIMRLTSK